MSAIATNTNNEFYYILFCEGNTSLTSKTYENKNQCILDLCKIMVEGNTEGKISWAQVIGHHKADGWQQEVEDLELVLSADGKT